MCLEKIVPHVPEIIGGSADLAASNLTFVKGMKTITAEDYDGNNLMYGIREHAMGAIMNGLALHGGVIPYGGTFFVFSDYVRPSIRLAALMGLRVVYVLTHDSIGVGEDGPTHQPVEHLASYRAMPNVLMFRPCDVVETAEAWQLALTTETMPSLLALSRQNLPLLRVSSRQNLTAKGGYVISDVAKGSRRQATIIATGSEVSIAVEAQKNCGKRELKLLWFPCPVPSCLTVRMKNTATGFSAVRRGSWSKLPPNSAGRSISAARAKSSAWTDSALPVRRPGFMSISALPPTRWRPRSENTANKRGGAKAPSFCE